MELHGCWRSLMPFSPQKLIHRRGWWIRRRKKFKQVDTEHRGKWRSCWKLLERNCVHYREGKERYTGVIRWGKDWMRNHMMVTWRRSQRSCKGRLNKDWLDSRGYVSTMSGKKREHTESHMHQHRNHDRMSELNSFSTRQLFHTMRM